jgi:hypothetical protein
MYKDGLPELWQEISTFMQMVKRNTSFEGDLYKIRVLYSGIGGSTNFNTAQNNMGVPGIADFGIDVAKDYALGSIDELTMKRTKSNRGAQAKALDTMVKSANYELQQSCSALAWGNGGGARAQLAASSSGVGTATITLKYSTDTFKFEVGMYVQAASTDGTSGAVAAGRAQISGIDRNAGTLTTAGGNWNAQITGITDDWYLFREGDFAGASPGTGTNVMTGIFGWTPPSAPSATAFWGVDRTADVVRLGGSRISGVGMPLSEAAFDARAEAKNVGGHPDVCFLNPKRFAELEKEAHAKQTFPVDLKGNTKVGVKGLGFHRSTGDVVFVEDYMCPYIRMLVTEMDSWELLSADTVPHFKTQAGDKLVWETSADAKGFRLAAYPQIVNHRPKGTTVVNLV